MNPVGSEVIDEAPKYLAEPDAGLISLTDQEEIRKRLDEIQSPSERLKELYISLIQPKKCPTHEGSQIRQSFLTGFVAGVLYGAILNAKSEHQRYIRKHNEQVFKNKYVGYRHVHDTLLPALAARGLKYGVRISALTGCATAIGLSSTTYRNELYWPDWLIGYSIFGGLTRLWLGPRAVAIGALLGSMAGMIGLGSVKCLEKITGTSLVEMRRTKHAMYAAEREAELRFHLESGEQAFKEKLAEES